LSLQGKGGAPLGEEVEPEGDIDPVGLPPEPEVTLELGDIFPLEPGDIFPQEPEVTLELGDIFPLELGDIFPLEPGDIFPPGLGDPLG